MNANERVPDALSDFDSIVRAGGSIDEAVAEAAKENDLKPDVVRARAEKAFGDLETYQKRCVRAVKVKAERRAMLQPLAEFIDKIYSKSLALQLQFIPIGHFIRTHFPEGHERDEAFEFSREYQKKWRK